MSSSLREVEGLKRPDERVARCPFGRDQRVHPRDIRESLELLGKGRVKVAALITPRLPLEEAGKGFALVAEGKESIKVVLQPHG